MGFLLFDGIDDNVSFPEITIDGNYKITLLYKDATTVGEGYLLDSGASGASRLVANITAAGVVESRGYFTQSVYIDDVMAVNNKPSTVAGEINRVELTRTLGEADQTTLKVGTIFNRYAGSYNFGATLISLQIDIRDDSDNVTSTYFYDPNASSGTGLTLPETSLNNDGTLNNFPTDDSQWVEFAGAPPTGLSATSITAAPIYAGTTVTVNLSNATNAAGKTLSIPQGALTATAQDINSISFLAPDLKTFGDKTGDYSSNITVTVTDGAESDTIDFQILPDVGDEVGAITAVEGIYGEAAFAGTAVTDLYYTTTITDADFTVGAVPVLGTEQVFSLWIQDQTDGVWGSVFTITIPASVVSGDIPPASRISVFHIAAALRALETYTHNQTNELVLEWLESEGVSRSNLNVMLYGYLGGLGYTGTMNERLYRWSN